MGSARFFKNRNAAGYPLKFSRAVIFWYRSGSCSRCARARTLRVSTLIVRGTGTTGLKRVRRFVSLPPQEQTTMSDVYFGTDLFGELDRLQRQMSSLFGSVPSSLRSSRFGTFPHINIGTTDSTIEIVAFAPGIDPAKLDISIDKGLLSIAGQRSTREQSAPEGARQYAQERFSGAFRRAVELPQQADPDKVQARYVDGCLLISVGKREASKPRAITVQ
jgi:HSP20 family protein